MTVNDLIAVLEKWDGDMPVCVAYEDNRGAAIQSVEWAEHNTLGPVLLIVPAVQS